MKKEKYTNYLRVTDSGGNQLVVNGWYREIGNGKIAFGNKGEILTLGW